ncbi:unnamed protein product, partial [Iphiclides podalirius]
MAPARLSVVLVLQFLTRDIYTLGNTLNFKINKDIVTDSGVVRGHVVESGDYFAFLGIPYAAPTTGSQRFKGPLPPKPWDTTFIADRKVVCPQSGIGEEDCLVVNVFVPTDKANGKLPVLVYIHGGLFLFGAGPTEGMEPLIRLGVVIVTINYRLGPLGFLCLANDHAPGNAGLKDQVAALEWVKKNIENFSGDPDNVTVYGTDAGAACIELLVQSKANRNLFQKVIFESGSSNSAWAIDKYPLTTAKDLARAFTVSGIENPQKLLELYQNVPAEINARRGNTVYLMEFAYRGKMGEYDDFYKDIAAAGHGDFANHIILKRPIQTSSDQLAIDRAAMLMVNFMKYGNPTPNQTDLLPILWPTEQPYINEYFLFGTDLKVLNSPYSKRIEFWNQLYCDSGASKIKLAC